MKKTDQNGDFSCFEPFLSKRSLFRLNISIFLECKIPKRESFPYIYNIF